MSDPANPPPEESAGLEPGGGVAPGDTPPNSSQVSGALGPSGPDVPDNASRIGVTLVLVGAAIVAALFAVMAVVRGMG